MTEDSSFLFSALALGFLGSFHCLGMCGPIALALPLSNAGKAPFACGRLLYNAGRIITYALLGFILGMMGYAMALKGMQEELSIVTGVIIIAGVLFSLITQKSSGVAYLISRFTNPVKKGFKNLFGKNSMTALFLIGILNGLLPCGFV
jgi:sulfite exporter TauE/SafE